MYNAFISYRKASSVNADFIRQSIADNSVYSLERIFLDKHSIGPELFNNKIKKAIIDSKCVLILVTKDCFIAKEDRKEDWFLEEIKTAITHKKTIIPILFDKIESLSSESIISELKKNFTSQEIEILTKSQSVPYSYDFPEASIRKIISFVAEANKTLGIIPKAIKLTKSIATIVSILAAFFVLFFGLGVLWGYFHSSIESDSVLADNTIINDSLLHFEYGGWNAIYDLNNDSITIDIEDYYNKPKVESTDLVLASFTYTGAKLLLDKNLSYLKYLHYLKGGSKHAKIAFLCASAIACVGAFCGFSQGSNFGKTKRQEETALLLYPKLQQRSTWKPLIEDNLLLKLKYQWWELARTPNAIAIGSPDSSCIAFKSGIRQPLVLLKYNNWEIGRNRYKDLIKEIEDAKNKEKYFVFLNLKDSSVSTFNLPKGTVGISFNPGDGNKGRYDIACIKFREWMQQQTKNAL